MPDLLLEVLSEEIPARMQAGGSDELKKQVLRRLEEARLRFDADDVKSFATPRRLALIVPGLPAEQPDITVERKGPRVDAPEKAIQGFLKSTGLTLEDCEQRETPKGPVWFAVRREKGRPTGALLTELLPEALAAVSWPKSMRWDESGVRWVRPIRSILCLLDGDVVPFRFGTVESGRTTLGHRFLSSGPLTIGHVHDYATTLEAAKAMLDPKDRLEAIGKGMSALAESGGPMPEPDHGLVDENAGLVEWPVVLMGTIDKQFMELPAEVLRSAMGTHQRYFSVRGSDGKPSPHFVMVADGATDDSKKAVIAGNERVLRARLADALFFLNQDRRQSLAGRVPQLKGVVFHAGLDSSDFGIIGLGSMYEKTKRIEALAQRFCDSIDVADSKSAARAGLLCKADLVTETVGEFPDLQGIMGSYYARADGEEEAVSKAIREHYAPQGPNDECPKATVSVVVALADKLDTLAALFAIDERPTGSKDPFALRRAALGVIRIIIENRLRLSLDHALTEALNTCRIPEPFLSDAKWALVTFFEDRLKVYLRDQGKRHDLVSAVFAAGDDDLTRIMDRSDALELFLDSEDGANLLTAYRRAANILRIEEKKDGQRYHGEVDRALCIESEEHILHERIAEVRADADLELDNESFVMAMAAMATLRQPVDDFFDNVTVNCDKPELRRNRLLMLSQIRATLDRVADFSKIEG